MRVVVNADDYGLSRGVDAGIVEAIAAGAVTSVSALPGGPSFAANSAMLAALDVDVGLHLAVGPAAGERRGSLAAAWIPRTGALATFRAQRQRLEDALGRAVTHVDSHMHVHTLPWLRHAAGTVAAEAGLPLRVPWSASATLKARALRATWSRPAVAVVGLDPVHDLAALWAALDAARAAGFDAVEWLVHPGHITPDHPPWDDLRGPREADLALVCAAAPALRDRGLLARRRDLNSRR